MSSRVEEVILASIKGNRYTAEPMSRIEELLKELNEVIISGGIDENEVIDILNNKVIDALQTDDKTVIGAINELLSKIKSDAFNKKVVDELPTELISTNTIYFLRDPDGSTENLYTEWMYIINENTGEGHWEPFGSDAPTTEEEFDEMIGHLHDL